MHVSVCIVNWNTRELLRRCLKSIDACTQGLAHEVIVVDNHSMDDSAAMVAEEFPHVRLIASEINHGFARGSNLAARSAVGDCILYLNPDTEIVTNALFGMWQTLATTPSCGAVSCRLLNTNGSVQLTCASAIPSPRNELSSMLLLDRLFPRSRWLSARELGYWDHGDSRNVDCLSGACLMARRNLLEQLGGFDESLFMYGEDVDLCCRIAATGQTLRYLASEVVFHHEGAASKKKGPNYALLRQRAANCYVLGKHFGPLRALAYRGAVSVGAVARVAGAVILGPLLLASGRIGLPEAASFLRRHVGLLLWSVGLQRVPAR
jgi:N-acetylglucosaminyl-diphospho-decaprenol L-rhamnosyltransferase